MTSTALGLVMVAGEPAGGFLAPVIARWACDTWGLQSAVYISAAGGVVVVLLSLGLRETAPAVLRRRAGAALPGPALAPETTSSGSGMA
ncbi:hypothetical protein [Streptomyces diastatochromogenes]|uniref:Uncharacterized protein n=1 Tax=Streptomyces diastatochromogenes TaxID=42236 RepID=A0A233RR09_STRDA|nr:hypothetical protein [Streptomyces diastatochromogenes]OXY85822.1 hypothetical protein BEK98_45295 [Streptomyces diastatochromogenes]